MPSRQRTPERLHPKLRVVQNADDPVNARRSEISACVVSVYPDADEEAPEAVPKLIALQEGMRDLSADPASLRAGRLGVRPKLKHPSRQAYVNVVIELERDADQEGDGALAMAAALKKELEGVAKKIDRSVRGPVLQRRNFVSATIPIDHLPRLERDPRVAFVHRAEPLKLDVPPGVASTRAPRTKAVSGAGRGAGVLIGIIDVGGFDFAHQDFRDGKGKTRFVGIWDQGGDFRPPPRGFDYGAEFTGTQLNAAIRAAKRKDGLPAHLLEPQSQRSVGSHGTHVASIAAGKSGVCPEAKIAGVLVSLPPQEDPFVQRRLTFSDASRILHAVEYLLKLAEAKKLPLSINISLGTNGGAHDGSSGVSRWLDALLAVPGRSICVAAGNAGQEAPTSEDDFGWIMGRIHTSGRIPSRGLDVDLEWTVIGNGIADVSENELEIWYSAQDRISVQVLPPGTKSWLTVAPGEYIENKRLPSGCTVSIYNELYHPTNGENYIAVYLSPNLERRPFRGVDAGVWKVRLHGDEIRDGRFHGWVERDDPGAIGRDGETDLFRFPSFFTTTTNVDSHSISSLACGHRVVAVANLDEELRRVNVTSSQGPTRDGRQKPDVAANGTGVVAAKGFAGDGDLWVAMSGTSMASPYVAGVIGLMLEAKRDLTSAQCASILRATAQPLPGTSYEWRNDSGFGCIAPKRAVDEAKSFGRRQELR